MWMPRLPVVLGMATTSPRNSATSLAASRTWRSRRPGGVEVDAQLVGVFRVGRSVRPQVEPEAAQVTAHSTWARSAVTRACDVVPLGVETIVVSSQSGAESGTRFWKNDDRSRRWGSAGAGRAVAHGAHERRPRRPRSSGRGRAWSAPLGEEDLVGAGDRDGPARRLDVDGFAVGGLGHGPTVSALPRRGLARYPRRAPARRRSAAGTTSPRPSRCGWRRGTGGCRRSSPDSGSACRTSRWGRRSGIVRGGDLLLDRQPGGLDDVGAIGDARIGRRDVAGQARRGEVFGRWVVAEHDEVGRGAGQPADRLVEASPHSSSPLGYAAHEVVRTRSGAVGRCIGWPRRARSGRSGPACSSGC